MDLENVRRGMATEDGDLARLRDQSGPIDRAACGDASASRVGRIAIIGNSLPRRCGIATFTTDLQQAIATGFPGVHSSIVAMTDHAQVYVYPISVRQEVDAEVLGDYVAAAAALNAGRFDVVCLQHEFGIFGGEAGGHILTLLSRLTMPVVTTLHTVLAEPTPAQRKVMDRLVDLSARLVVMAEKARDLLETVYGVAADRIEVIPHGIPDFPFVEPDVAKAKLGFGSRPVILTFGLLSPNKGIEVMIDAMPGILERQPDAVYVVLGATHPNLVRNEGEAYRKSLVQRARALGIEDRVVLLDRFVDRATLIDFISMCDVYVTPYLSEAQMTSGTLAYSFGLGKAVVSTPYWHARELLADGGGILVPFADPQAIGQAIGGLLTDPVRRDAMRKRAYATSRSMTWERTAQRYLGAFEKACRDHRPRVVDDAVFGGEARGNRGVPEIELGHFLVMCDDTGLFQHAVHAVADRDHGYCVDDNARALLLACALEASGEPGLPETLTGRFTAFVQHAWNPDTRRFRNFMSFERRWLEPAGSEDSHGRTLWALGVCARDAGSTARRRWAADLVARAAPTVEGFTSPRAWAFALLGLEAHAAAFPDDPLAYRLQRVLADRLVGLFMLVHTPSWAWFETGLSYDNARLPEALILTGLSTGIERYVSIGLRALRWLTAVQTAPSGNFRPVGTDGFHHPKRPPATFDQQPLEATATIAACMAAWRADGDEMWRTEAMRAFDWFHGRNDLSLPLVDPETGACRDGLHPDRANENCGGESVVCYLLALSAIRRANRLGEGLKRPEPHPA